MRTKRMKIITAILAAFLLLLSGAGANSAEQGQWVPAEDPTVTEETFRLVTEALDGLVGVGYRPVTYLGFRTVEEGTIHAILCQKRIVLPGATPKYVIFYVLEDEQGSVELKKIADFNIGLFYPD